MTAAYHDMNDVWASDGVKSVAMNWTEMCLDVKCVYINIMCLQHFMFYLCRPRTFDVLSFPSPMAPDLSVSVSLFSCPTIDALFQLFVKYLMVGF